MIVHAFWYLIVENVDWVLSYFYFNFVKVDFFCFFHDLVYGFKLKNATPVRYAEVHVSRKDEASYMKDITLEEGDRPEIYTEEHEKLLGNTDKTWTMVLISVIIGDPGVRTGFPAIFCRFSGGAV
ncbi:hypothetical protein ACFX2F_030146 [Malus domestica]